MLDMVLKNRVIDLGDTVWMFDIRNVFMDVFRLKKGNFVSAIEKKVKAINKVIDKAIDAFSAEN